MKYRADIDGLRAVAVLGVLLFHAGITPLSGGFVGVDIFFVISGFLITSLLVLDQERGSFSILDFYERRARRILPALFVMLAVTVAVGLAVMLPTDFAELARAATATSLFVSNVHFWQTSSYFDGASELKPLLHTWSLGVEEQFYIVFPVLVALAWRYGGRRSLGRLVAGGFAVSFALGVTTLGDHPSAAFYLAPTRAWELLLGAGLALGLVPQTGNRWVREAAGLAGAGLILWCMLTYTEGRPFPGVRALWPCLGAALLIHARTSIANRALSLRPVVFVGLISYSLYLWHWPVVVFARYEGLFFGAPLQIAAVLAASFALAILSWCYVEGPFKSRALLPARPQLLRVAAACIVGAVAIGLTLGAARRPVEVAAAEEGRAEARAAYGEGECFFSADAPLDAIDPARCLTVAQDRPNVLLIGDSFAAHLWPGLRATLGDRVHLSQFTYGGCPPLRRSLWTDEAGCVAVTRAALNAARSGDYDVVLMAANWRRPELPALRRTLALLKPSADRIVVFGPMVTYRGSLPEILESAEDPERDVVKYRNNADDDERRIRAIARQLGVGYVSMTELMCPGGMRNCILFDTSGAPIQWDNGHLTELGSRDLIRRAEESGSLTLY